MSHRKERVASELRHQLADILTHRVSDPRLASVTVVEVRPSPDFTFARVFYRTHGDPREVGDALERAKPFIRHCLAEVSALRRVPELDLRLDTSVERAQRVDELLGEVASMREAAAEEQGAERGGESE
jgi:ribosome-binding factor A